MLLLLLLLLLILYQPFNAFSKPTENFICALPPCLVIRPESKLALGYLVGVLAAFARGSAVVDAFDLGATT